MLSIQSAHRNTYSSSIIPTLRVGELTFMDAETAYLSASYHRSPGGAVDRLAIPTVTKGDPNYLLGVDSVIVDSHCGQAVKISECHSSRARVAVAG